MGRSSSIRTALRNAALPAAAIIAICFFGYNAVMGPNGVLAYKEVREQVAQRTVELQKLEKQRATIKNHVDLLDPARGADPDLADELARKQLNVVKPGEIIVPLKQ